SVITILKSYSAQIKTPPMIFGGVHKKFKNYFLFITKQILYIRTEHRRRIRCATNFASLLLELNLLAKNSLLIF
ncbi:MAG: hypothetical protein M3R14_04925, partial [Acidobacteriota bacterium]|nr:hypothetical protein [Acidobacteriota bacterium]